MRVQSNALLLIAATLIALSGSAFAQKAYRPNVGSHVIRSPNSQSSRHPTFRPSLGNGGHGWRHPRWHGSSGIILRFPTRGVIVERHRHPRHRTHHHRVTHRKTHHRSRRIVQRRPSGVPPAGEHRYVPDEVLVEVANSTSTAEINALQRRYRLARLAQQQFQLSGTTFYLWRIPDRRSVATVVRVLERDAAVVSAQPNYQFTLQQADAKPAAGNPAQYAVAKLRLLQAHVLAEGNGVRVAMIDSGVDVASPELAGSITATFDALPGSTRPHEHGTAIASLIAGHDKLLGVAPKARILAVRAFDPAGTGTGAQGTTFSILKGLDWAVAHKARVINMSFCGPNDPALHRSLAAAHAKGVVLVAAAGNGGPKSQPLYPAADGNVIAVTATDDGNELLAQANRGRYIDVAAPGAQILVAIPGGYEVSSGTSYSAAEVSGIAALMLQRAPRLRPDKLRNILERTAKDLGPKGRDSEFGAGLADALAAVMTEGAVTAGGPRSK